MVHLDKTLLRPFLEPSDFDGIAPRVGAAHRTLLDKSGAGSEFLGWQDLVAAPNDALLEEVSAVATEIRERADVLLCIGIGGSYLGAEGVIQALCPAFRAHAEHETGGDSGPLEVVFAGHHMGSRYLGELLAYLDGKSVFVNVISKSGTTLEPALAFRFLRRWMEDHFEDASNRIIVTTDPDHGALKHLAGQEGYRRFEIPRSVGGRFSVLTPVGLLPAAAAGIDIRSLLYGAVAQSHRLRDVEDNPALDYAAARCLLEERGYAVDLLAVFDPNLRGLGLWWQQLFAESEGKERRGMFPSVLRYSTDLHSVGQYVQEGKRSVVETFLMVEEREPRLDVPVTEEDVDGLNYLSGRPLAEINRIAYEGTAAAHHEGGVPVMTLWLRSVTPETIGACVYFFQHSVSVSSYLLGVNPFTQPGVEAYKRKMFSLLGRPGV